jgi:FkbM family methyltransferase
MNTLSKKLNDLLDNSENQILKRQEKAFDEIAQSRNNSIVLYGSGRFGRKILALLRLHSTKVIAFVDNNSLLWGSFVDGLSVFSPIEACHKFGRNSLFIITVASPGHSFIMTRNKLIELGCDRIISSLPLLWKYAPEILPYYSYETPLYFSRCSPIIKKALKLFADDKSQEIFIEHIRYRMTGRFDNLPSPDPEKQYFPSFINLRSDEVFVDCGAFDGDTIRGLLERTVSPTIFGYEPDPKNFQELEAYVGALPIKQRKKIHIYQNSLGSKTRKIRFAASGTAGAAASDTGDKIVNEITLDSQLFNPSPTFIKMDIEGGEGAALQGAKKLIRACKPTVAVCAYHRPDDLWRLPLQLIEMNRNYRFFLRSYDYDGWETVLYAVDKSIPKNN